MATDLSFPPKIRDVDFPMSLHVALPRALAIAVSSAKQIFPSTDNHSGPAADTLLLFAGTVLFGEASREPIEEEIEEDRRRTLFLNLRDRNSGKGRVVTGAAACAAQSAVQNDEEDNFAWLVENALVDQSGDDVFLFSDLGGDNQGELLRIGYQASVLEHLGRGKTPKEIQQRLRELLGEFAGPVPFKFLL